MIYIEIRFSVQYTIHMGTYIVHHSVYTQRCRKKRFLNPSLAKSRRKPFMINNRYYICASPAAYIGILNNILLAINVDLRTIT